MMTIDTQIRDHLQTRTANHVISVSSLQDITTAGDRSVRRTRFAGGFCAVALVMVGLFGYAGLRSPDAPTTMFAGLQEDTSGSPATIIATEDGWLGAVLLFDEIPAAPWSPGTSGEIHLATSVDGESWELAAPTGLSSDYSDLAIAEHRGRVWLALTENNGAYLAHSDDLENWTRVDLPEANDFDIEASDGMVQTVFVRDIVANDAGVMATIGSQVMPDFEALVDFDPISTCGIQWAPANFGGPSTIDLRRCGQSVWETTEFDDADLFATSQQMNLVFSDDGETFEVVDRPISNRSSVFAGVPNLYSTGTGFGLADFGLIESGNGADWTTLDVDRFSSVSFGAARGDQRLSAAASSMGTVWVQVSDDGVEWTTNTLDDVLGPIPPERQRTFTIRDLQASEAGWALSAFVADFYPTNGPFMDDVLDITLQLGDAELRGTMPGGPAELIGPDGERLASWDEFELSMLLANEFINRDGSALALLDSDGQVVFETTEAQFADQLQLTTTAPLHVVLFSTDGVDWVELHRGVDPLTTLAMDDDEIVVVQHSFDGPSSIRFPIESD